MAPVLSAPQSAVSFDVFLSHNSLDKPVVERVAEKLKRAGLEPWLDKWCLTPGGDWQDELAAGLRAASACAVLVGTSGIGNWEDLEYKLATDRMAKDRSFRLFLVLLPGLPEVFDTGPLPPFLSLRTWVDLRKGIDDPGAFQSFVNAVKGLPLGPSRTIEPRDDVCPYRGLQTFNQEDARFFFGRDGDIQRLIERLKATRFLAVLGASGSGKSSLVRAGLVPALSRGSLGDSDTWHVRTFTPGAHPLTNLTATLLNLFPHGSMHDTLDQMTRDDRTLHLAAALGLAASRSSERVLWIVDQFEEIFTLCLDENERGRFLGNLVYAALVPGGRNLVVLTMRADFYHKCAAFPELAAQLAAQHFLVGPMDAGGLRQAIEEPAWLVGLELEPGLAGVILEDVANQPGALPLLEHALLELWNRRRGKVLTLEAYRESGGVHSAIAKRAETIYAAFGREEQTIVRRTMLRLTQPGDGTEDTRRRAAITELITGAAESEAVERVVQAMADAHLLVTSRDADTGERWVDVAHEALIRGWPRLRKWIDEDRAGLRVHRQLTEAAHEWRRLDRDESTLYRGVRLAQAVEWQDRSATSLNELEKEFLAASVALRAREQREAEERRQKEIRDMVQMEEALHQAREQRRVALSRELAATASARLSADAELSMLLAVEAARIAPTRQAEDALRQALLEFRQRVVVEGHNSDMTPAVLSPDGALVASAAGTMARVWELTTGRTVLEFEASDRELTHVLFSPDGRFIVTVDHWGPARVWNAQTADRLFELKGETGQITGAAFSPDSLFIITADGHDRSAQIWEADTGQRLRKPTRLGERVDGPGVSPFPAVFSPDSNLAAAGSSSVLVWRVSTGRRVTELKGFGQHVSNIAFTPDGTRVLTSGSSGGATLWEVPTRKRLKDFRHGERLNAATLGSDGKLVVTASWDGTARVWDLRDSSNDVVLRGHQYRVTAASFSPDDRYVVTASEDHTARVWDAATGLSLAELRGHRKPVYEAIFSPDGRSILTEGADGNLRVWEWQRTPRVTELRGHKKGVNDAHFNSDGTLAATASEDRTARIWEVSSGECRFALRGHKGTVRTARFSPDGRFVSTSGDDNTVRLWETATGRCATELGGHSDSLTSVAFSTDSKLVVTADEETVRVWESGTGRNVTSIAHDGLFADAQFSPDGQFIVTASRDGIARIWAVRNGECRTELTGHKRRIFTAEFSVDGRYVLTASRDGTARVWDAASGQCVAVVPGKKKDLNGAIFSPDGTLVLTARRDGITRLWQSRGGALVGQLQGQTLDVHSWEFSRDGSLILTVARDGIPRVWEASSGRSLVELREHPESVLTARFSHDNRYILTVSNDGTACVHAYDECGTLDYLLNLAQRRVMRELTAEERRQYLHEETGGPAATVEIGIEDSTEESN